MLLRETDVMDLQAGEGYFCRLEPAGAVEREFSYVTATETRPEGGTVTRMVSPAFWDEQAAREYAEAVRNEHHHVRIMRGRERG